MLCVCVHLRAGACLFVCVCVIDSMVPFPPCFNVDTSPDGGLASHKLDRCIAYHWHQAVGWVGVGLQNKGEGADRIYAITATE